MSIKKLRHTMRRELSCLIIGLAAVTAFAYTVLLELYFDRGMQEIIEASMIKEVRAFERRYLEDKNTPLPSSYTTHFYFDDWQAAPVVYKSHIPFDELEINRFYEFEWLPNGEGDWSGAHYFFVYWSQLQDGRNLYVVTDYDTSLFTDQELKDFDESYQHIIYYTGAYLLLMLLAVWSYNRRLNKRIQSLAGWAESLTMAQINEPAPDFRYGELNRIAGQLQQAFQRIASLLERQHDFLRHASHELRTPIATVRANMELLERVGVPSALKEPINRVGRANQGMQQLTETLLWLSRENDEPPKYQKISVHEVMDELSEELKYLLQNKSVQVKRCYGDASLHSLPETPLRIVMSNLIRNAFQHTEEGQVTLTVDAGKLIVENCDQGDVGIASHESFGLGLMLVTQVCDRLGWSFSLSTLAHGVRAELTLPINQN